MQVTDENRLFENVLRTFDFRHGVDQMNGLGGGYFMEAYDNPENGQIVYTPAMMHAGIKYYRKMRAVNCGQFTFDVEEVEVPDENDDEGTGIDD